MTDEPKLRRRKGSDNSAYVTYAGHRYTVTCDWRPRDDRFEMVLWSDEGRKVFTTYGLMLGDHQKQALKEATVADIERRQRVAALAAR